MSVIVSFPQRMSRDAGEIRALAGGVLPLASIVAIGGVLTWIFTLPLSVRRSLSFTYTDPSIRTAYTAPFVHFSLSHLVGNLLAFFLAAGVLCHLSRRARSPWLFPAAIATAVTAFPVTLSFLNLAIPRDAFTYGFSGVNMALVGFLPIAVGRYVESRLRRPIQTGVLLSSFFLSTAYIATASVPRSTFSLSVAAVSLVLGVAFVGRERRYPAPETLLRSAVTDPSIVAGVGAWLLLLALAFPRVVVRDGSVVNVYGHFLGYSLGFMTAYLAHEWELFGTRSLENAEKADSSSVRYP